jgi:radical SAM superfamily enzyme YgiQ (UPF0313 family)
MRFLLINSPIRLGRPANCFPTGLGIVAQVLLDGGHEVEVLDANALRLDTGQVLDQLPQHGVDAIAISGLVSTYRFQHELIAAIKARQPHVPLIAGGGCATSVPQLMMERTPIDLLVVGEGEQTVLELAGALERDEPLDAIPGLVFRGPEGPVVTAPRAPAPDLDGFPLPAYDRFPTELYVENPIWIEAVPSMNVISSRGCPMDCNFCYNLFGRRSYRTRGVDAIAAEVHLLKRDYGVRYISFVDDNLTINRRHLRAVCEVMEAEGVGWGCHGRVDTATDDRLAWMAASGCDWLGFGIESGSQRILDRMSKRATVEGASAAIRRTRAHGIHANTTFIIGYPGEDLQSIQETLRFKVELDCRHGSFFATPYPGTQLYDDAQARGLIEDEHTFVMQLGDAGNFVINLTDFSDEQLQQLSRRSFEELKIAVTYRAFDPAQPDAAQLVHAGQALLEQGFILPEIKAIVLRAMARYFDAAGDFRLAAKLSGLARQFPSTAPVRAAVPVGGQPAPSPVAGA